MNYKADFKEGDLITFCDEEFIVMENYGYSGKVKERYSDTIVNNFYWEYEGERCKIMPKAPEPTEQPSA